MASRLTAIIVVAIVAVTFIAGLIVGAQRDDANGPVDLIILNGRLYPGGGRTLQEAVAVRGNRILRVGSNREIKRLRRAQTLVLDAHGAAVMPGFFDSHVQLVDGALALDQIDLTSMTTLDAVQQEVQRYATANRDRAWILGRSWRSHLSSTDVRPRLALDAAVSDRPVYLLSEDGQAAWVNSRALALAGITTATRSPRRGSIGRDPRTGEPTGVLKGTAQDLVRRAIPPQTRSETLVALRHATAEANRLGVTSVQTVSAKGEELDLLNEIRRSGDLTLRVYGAVSVSPNVREEDVEQLDQVRSLYPDDPMLKMGAVEILCDVGCSPADLERAVTLLDRHQWQTVIHADSETTVRAALDAFEHAAAVNPPPPGGRRPRLETVAALDPADLSRAQKLGIFAELSGESLLEVLAARDETQIPALVGSHWPTASMDPLVYLESLINANPDSPAEAAPRPTHTIFSAIDAYTSNAADASYDEQRKGELAPGMLADIVILSADIFEDPGQRVRDSVVSVTIFDGKVVYQRDAERVNDSQ